MSTAIVMRMLAAGILSASLQGCHLKELLSPSGVLGTSSLSASIDGAPMIFGSIAASSYFGVSVRASSAGRSLRLYLWYGQEASHTWGPYGGEMLTADTSAFLDDREAIAGWGGFTISSHDHEKRRIRGHFSFAVLTPDTSDTTFVTHGAFDLYYPYAD